MILELNLASYRMEEAKRSETKLGVLDAGHRTATFVDEATCGVPS